MLTLPTQPLSPLLSLSEGDLLGTRYRIESLLRSRPSGVWFAATDLTCGKRVEAHVLVVSSSPGSPPTPREDEARVSFLNGARRAKLLVGPHIARVLDAGVTFEGHPWLVRELVATESLEHHLKTSGALGVSESVDIALSVIDAIAEAHANGIVHGSLGPHAVHAAYSASGLVDVKVTGTGTSSVENELSLGATGKVESVLRSPEQITSGARVDGRADVWALGALLHTMLAGAPPFTADTPSGASLSVVLDEPPSLAGVPDELGEIVDRALSKNPDVRQRSVIDFADAIVRYASHPDIAQDRIDARRSLLTQSVVLRLGNSEPTINVDKRAYLALSREQQIVNPAEAELVEVSPSVRDLVVEANRPASIAPPPPQAQAQLPTRRAIGHTLAPVPQSFPRRRAFRIMGLATAAASVALLVLIGTEGARLRSSSPSTPARAPAAEAPAPAQTNEPLPPSTVVIAPPPAATPLPLPSAAAAPTPRHTGPAKRTRQTPAPTPTPQSVTTPSSPSSEPASKPSTSGSGDDLRRFLDDRR